MMEATTHNQLGRLLFFLVILTCILPPQSIQAQTNSPDPILGQLLDSAEILKYKSQFNEAIAICDKVKNEAEKINDWPNLARALSELAEINRYFNEYEICQKLLEQSEEIITTHLDITHVEMARNLFYQGKLKRYLRDESDGFPSNVFSSYLEAEKILKKLGGYPKELALLWVDLGGFYNRYDSLSHAKKCFGQLEHVLKDGFQELDYIRGFCLFYLGRYYNLIADYERAILNLNLARYIFSHPSNHDITRLLRSEMDLGGIYYNSDQFQYAIIHYNEVISIAEEYQIQDKNNLLGTYSNLGRAYYEVDKMDSSFFFTNLAMLLHKNNKRGNDVTYSNILLTLGLVYSKTAKYEMAKKYFLEALKQRIEIYGEKSYWTHVFYRNIGNDYIRRRQIDEALENYQKGLIALFPSFNSANIYDEPPYEKYERKEDVLYILTEKAGAFYDRYLMQKSRDDLFAAHKLYTILYALSDELLNSGMMDESMIQIFLGFKKGFKLSVECAFDLYQETNEEKYYQQAFQFIEKSRYILLQKALISSMYKTDGGVNNELFLQERQLNHDINELKYHLANTENTQAAFDIRNLLFNKLVDKGDITTRIDNKLTINRKDYLDSLELTVNEIQDELIKENELIIEYHWAQNYINALVFSKSKNELFKIDISPDLLNQINIYANSISGEMGLGASREEFNNYVNAAFYLYTQLLDPIFKHYIDQNEAVSKATIIPDGQLSFLPFESLLTEFPDTTDISYWSLPYLLKETSVSYAYSLNILKNNLMMNQQIENPDLLAFSYSATVGENDELAYLRSENELRYSAEELNSIQSVIRTGDYYEDVEATEALFKEKATNYSLIHLALHGQADVADRYNSNLIFKDDSTSTEDGALHAYELYNLDLSNTEMAVLSACETGLGMQTEGEGIFSIARGFAFAGCPSIFMSLWKVSDKTTATIMEQFYQNLANGMQKDKALQQAKLAYIQNSDDTGSHPANWAAFIALGNNKPIQLPGSMINWYYIISLIIVISIIVYLFYLRRQKIVQS